MLSAVIITNNEERNIGRCLASLEGVADEIVVVDSGSTDKTADICRANGARFISHPWAGFAEQKNYANSLTTCEWILSVDADEELSEELRKSLLVLKAQGFDNGTIYSVNRLNNYCGHWIKHGGWYPDRKQRLFERDAVQWEGAVHETLKCTKTMRQVLLEGDLLHYSYNSFSELAQRQQKYAELSAKHAKERGRNYGRFARILHPRWTFFRNYFLKLGFLDGRAGYTICRMSAYYTFMKITLCQKGK